MIITQFLYFMNYFLKFLQNHFHIHLISNLKVYFSQSICSFEILRFFMIFQIVFLSQAYVPLHHNLSLSFDLKLGIASFMKTLKLYGQAFIFILTFYLFYYLVVQMIPHLNLHSPLEQKFQIDYLILIINLPQMNFNQPKGRPFKQMDNYATAVTDITFML